MTREANRAPTGRLRDAAGLLPWLGALLLATPAPLIFVGDDGFSSEFLIWWAFCGWAASILAAAVISVAVGRDDGAHAAIFHDDDESGAVSDPSSIEAPGGTRDVGRAP